MISRRHLIGLAGLATLGSVAACSPSQTGSVPGGTGATSPAAGGGGTGGGAKTTLSVWSWRTEDKAAYEKIFAEFTKKNPDIAVTFQPYKNTEYNQILATGLKGAQGPDVAQLKSYGGLQALVNDQSLTPLGDDFPGLEGFPAGAIAAMTARSDGKIYGVPFAIQTLQMFYSKKVFTEQGVDVPETWEDFLAACEKLKAAGIIPISLGGGEAQVQVPVFADIVGSARYGGQSFYEDVLAGRKDFTDPDYVAGLELAKTLQPYLPDSVTGTTADDARILFLTGKAAMLPALTAEMGVLLAQDPELEIGTFPVPAGDGWAAGKAVTPGFVDGGWGVSAKSPNQEAAMKLVEWMATTEFGQLFSDELKQITPVPGVEIKDESLAEMSQRYAESPAPYLMLVGFRYGQPWGTELVGTGVQELWLGQKSAEQVAADIQQGLEAWFEPES